MENLACIVFVFAIYCIFACAAYCPKSTATIPEAEQPINYFPDDDDAPSWVHDEEPEPQGMGSDDVEVEIEKEVFFAAQPVAKQPKAKATLSSLLREEVGKDAPSIDLNKMGVRDLYRIAQQRGDIRGYKSMSKSTLIALLA